MIVIRRRKSRSGYAMVLVLVFVVLFLGLWSIAARQVGSMLRIEQARAGRVSRDAERLPAATVLAQALASLETGYPPSSPYTCSLLAANGNLFAITFTRDLTTTDQWIVSVAPTSDETLPPLNCAQFGVTSP